MNSNFLNIIILLGAVQALIIAALLLFSKKNNRYANKLLGFLILSMGLACLNLYTQVTDLYSTYSGIRWFVELVPLLMAMSFGPLFYFYARSVTNPAFRLTKKDYFQFIPVILDLVPHLIVWFFVIGVYSGLINHESGKGWGDFIDEYNAYCDIPRWISMTIYTWLSLKYLKTFLLSRPGEKDNHDYRWLSHFFYFLSGFQILWLIHLVPYIIPGYRYEFLELVGWYPLYIPIVIMVYWLGIRGYIQSQITSSGKPSRSPSFSPETVSSTIEILTRSMKDSRLYRDPALTVTQLSTYLKIPQKTISGVLNQHLGKSFNEFINEFRIEEVKEKLTGPEKEHFTITGIAFECGFNSQATFQRAFKSVTHLSPSEFLERQKHLARS